MAKENIELEPMELGRWLYEEYCLSAEAARGSAINTDGRPMKTWGQIGIMQQVWMELGQRLWHREED